MERGLLWLPLLAVFIGLAWAGWNEYRKIEAYQHWAAAFEHTKYDIYAILGQRSDELVWGRPTRQGPVQLQRVQLSAVESIDLYGRDRHPPSTAPVPRGCQACLRLHLSTGSLYWIPFTEVALAERWHSQLQARLDSLQSTPQSSS